MKDFREGVSGRFIRYTEYDSMSNPALCGKKRPTTDGQVVLQKALLDELSGMGLECEYTQESVVHGILRDASGCDPERHGSAGGNLRTFSSGMEDAVSAH